MYIFFLHIYRKFSFQFRELPLKFYLLREMAIIIQIISHAFILSNDKRKSKISYNYILSNNNLQT